MGWLRRLFSGPPPTPANGVATRLPDHDPAVLKVTATSSAWKHTDACPRCRSPIGHNEFMTSICLSCGGSWDFMTRTPSAAMRKIVRGGRWVRTIRIRNVEYEKIDGEWVRIPREAPAEPPQPNPEKE